MFFIVPWAIYLLVYLAAALLPALLLMRYIYRKDDWEPEPVPLLISLALYGAVGGLACTFLEGISMSLLNLAPISKNSHLFTILTAFLGVAVVEEAVKAIVVYKRTWENRNFNYSFDAIVYSAFVSLGFAALENISYVFTYGLSVALPRAVLAIPGHFSFAVVFGYFYGRCREKDNRGLTDQARANLFAGYFMAVLLHGIYDSCAMIGTKKSMFIFVLFIAVMYLNIIRLVNDSRKADHPL